MLLKTAYTFFIGLLFAVFVGVGIAAFYDSPKPPEYPSSLKQPYPSSQQSTESAALLREQERFDKKEKEFETANTIYNRNVSIASLVFAILAVVISILFMKKLLIISDGLLLGGVFTLLYSIARGFQAQDNKFRFVVVAISFGIVLFLGYIKFIKNSLPIKK